MKPSRAARAYARFASFAKGIVTQHDPPPHAVAGGMFDRTIRWTDRIASITVVRLIAWVAIAIWVYQGVTSDAFKVAEWMDEHQFIAWEESDRMTLLRWGQLPAWNPYWCGGTVGIAAPEDPFLGPDFLLRIAFGVSHGRRLAILLLVVMGFEGMYRLCRRLDATVVASAFAAVIYGTCDRFVGFIHDGWINFLGFELIPWVVLCFLKGLESWRWRLLGGFFFAWIVLSAGTYTTPFTLLTVGYLTIALSVRGFFSPPKPDPSAPEPPPRDFGKRAWLTPWVVAITIGLVALALAFGKLLPTLAFLRQFPRVFNPVEHHGAPEMFAGFWIKYGVVAFFALVALVTADGAAAIFAGGVVLFFALAMGDFGKYTPFHLLKELPIFSQLRFPDRYMVVVLFFTSVCAARGITRLEDAVPAVVRRAWTAAYGAVARWRKWAPPADGKPRETPRELVWIAIGLTTFLAYKVVRPQAEEILELVRIKPTQMYVQEAPRTFDQPFRQHRGNRRDAHMFPPINMGTIYCVAGNPLPESALLRADLPQEEYPADPTKATVKRLSWSPNEIKLEVDAKEAATIHVNQNWAAEWRSDVGAVKSVEKLLAVDVPAGKHVVTLAYRDRALFACLMVSLVSLLAFVFVFAREGVRWFRRESAAWADIPTWPDEDDGEKNEDEEENEENEEKDEPTA
ncbi:MAG: hypothetical protein KF819_30485 [Labilithrix sp.]|nr:hypothetical protein [Labilithrix sp.]